MKKFLRTTLLGLLALSTLHTPSEASTTPSKSPISINIAGEILEPPVPPVNVNGVVLVPMRSLFEALNLPVNWNPVTRTITSTTPSGDLELTINNTTAYIDNSPVTLTTAPVIIDGATYVPLRFIGESSGQRVVWNNVKKTAYITSDETKEFSDNTIGFRFSYPKDYFIDVAGNSVMIFNSDPYANEGVDGIPDGHVKMEFYVLSKLDQPEWGIDYDPELIAAEGDELITQYKTKVLGADEASYSEILSHYANDTYINSLNALRGDFQYVATGYVPVGSRQKSAEAVVDFVLNTFEIGNSK